MTQHQASPIVLGVSLKTYFSHAQTLAWSRTVADLLAQSPAVADGSVEVFVAPTFPGLKDVIEILHPHAVGAQDVAATGPGAYTGEVTAAELAEIGVRLVEIGHAERRRLFGETPADVRAKCDQAFAHGLTPLVCVGEPEQAAPEVTARDVVAQVRDAVLADTDHRTERVVVAYEPFWAIGAAQPAPADYVRTVCDLVRAELRDQLPGLVLLYGGSAGPGTLSGLGSAVDGLFLGRFVHDPQNFGAVVAEAARLRGAG